MGAVGIFYNNFDGAIPTDITLDPCTLASIFSGKIVKWNDRAIQALNPGLSLPNLAITVVHQSTGSASTSGTTE